MGHCAPAGDPEAWEFGSFLFWRNPAPHIDRDLQELLADEGEDVPRRERKRMDLKNGTMKAAMTLGGLPLQHQADPAGLGTVHRLTGHAGQLCACRGRNPVCALLPQPEGAESPGPAVFGIHVLWGKYALNLHLTEALPLPHLQLSCKVGQKPDVFGPGYKAGVSPLAENDISSQLSALQPRQHFGAGGDGCIVLAGRSLRRKAPGASSVAAGAGGVLVAQFPGCSRSGTVWMEGMD